MTPTSAAPPRIEADEQERMRALLDNLSTYMQLYHGGSVELVSFDGDLLEVRLGGACVGCSISEVTLHGWIEGTVKPFFPELQEVRAVD